MGDIYLIRHAEAEGNRYRRIHGWYDSNVTKNGLRQIEALGRRFDGVPLAAVYASGLCRTRRTAAVLAASRNLAVQDDLRFRKIGLGVWEDRPFGELSQEEPEQLRDFTDRPDRWRAEGAETFRECTDRFLAALRALAEAHTGESIAVVTHGMALRAALQALFPDHPAGHSDNTAVTHLTWDGTFHLDYSDDNSHLSEEISTLARQRWWRTSARGGDRNLWFLPFEGEIDWYLRLADDAVPVAPMAAIFFAMLGKEPVGLLQLDPQAGQEDGAGTVDYLGLAPKYRGQGLGAQLVGCAVSYYRGLGRETLRLNLPERYARAAHFLAEEGFRPAGAFLEKDLCVPCAEFPGE